MMSSTTRRTPGTRRTRGLAIVAAAVAAAFLAGAAQAQAPKAGSPPMIKLEYEKYTLPNGLDVILRRDAQDRLTFVNQAFCRLFELEPVQAQVPQAPAGGGVAIGVVPQLEAC